MANNSIKKTVYFVRHGESVDNVAPVFQSEDSPLSDRGFKQADVIANRAAKLTFESLISSTQTRAKQTAEAIKKTTGKEPEYSELFVERKKPSAIAGKPHTDPEATNLWREWEKSLYTPGMRVQDSENFEDILGRADRALDFLKERSEQSIVVVTHGYFLKTIVARVLLGDELSDKAFRNFHRVAAMENTGLTVLRYQSAFEEDFCWRLWIYNDHAHLAD